jgi:hypothetical protein
LGVLFDRDSSLVMVELGVTNLLGGGVIGGAEDITNGLFLSSGANCVYPDGYGHRIHVPGAASATGQTSRGTIKAMYR